MTSSTATVSPAPAAGSTTPDVARYLPGVGAYLTHLWGRPTEAAHLSLVAGGNARATWRLDARGDDGSTRGLILRVAGGPELGLSSLQQECEAQTFAGDLGLPVPRPVAYVADTSWLGAPFALVEELPGCSTSVTGRHLPADVRARLGREMWQLLGQLAALPVADRDVPPTVLATALEDSATAQLDHWVEIYRRHEIHPHPVADAAIRWLRVHRPEPTGRHSLVHADYRLGNLMHGPDGEVRGIIDWEMAHLGDPLEDLAWSLDARQDANFPELAAGLIPHAEAVQHWQEASGLSLDPEALSWWQVMSAFKALGIWTISANHFDQDQVKRPVDGRIGWLLAERQLRILADLLSPHSQHVYYRYGR